MLSQARFAAGILEVIGPAGFWGLHPVLPDRTAPRATR